ncbi:MAG: glycoside hydrolase TIM-barrel-like domain-containing protein, partial [Pseudorhodoplanes sp.]
MAALLLSVAGASAGGALFGSAGAMIGRAAGAFAGSMIDRALFGSRGETVQRTREGPRLSDIEVMTSTDGAPIPRIYGRMRIAGQMIWATRLEEVVTTRTETTTTGGGGGGGKGGGGGGGGGGGTTVTTTTTTYSYFANFAIGLCEGPIGQVMRVWADGKPLDLAGVTMRIYRGDETQMPDPLIVAKDGVAPAYRGLAYVVFERLAVDRFGNRIPQLSFEVVRPVGALEQQMRAVTLIPGATEFGYQPTGVLRALGPGQWAAENRHVSYAPSDVVASLDALQAACPNLTTVAIVVAWFGDDLRAAQCHIRPGVDHAGKSTHGGTWAVAGIGRESAHLVSMHEGRAAFGGTPSDASVAALIAELKARDLKVTLYPFVMMDIPAGNALPDPRTGEAPQPAYPWRGEITCDPAPGIEGSPDGTAGAATQVDAFFTGSGPGDWRYRRMILHYANLAVAAGGVDAFLIGSELKGLTRVRAAPGDYPAASALATLAADVKAIVGEGTAITYGADWTEYGAHVVDAEASEVRFPLDALWSCAAIDAVGIDYYAPLADWRDTPDHLDRAIAPTIYERDYLAGNLVGGEAYDFHYPDAAARASQSRIPIADALGKTWMFRPKDLWGFWSQLHYERVDGIELASPTAWIPESKPIWLTEAGCPAVDKGANQPSVFPDLKSATGGYPHFSSGRRDDLIQRRYLETLAAAFSDGSALNPVSAVYGGAMVDPASLYMWTWDARPYPAFPAATDVWNDGPNWETGHWLTGRLGSAHLAGLVAAICADAGAG